MRILTILAHLLLFILISTSYSFSKEKNSASDSYLHQVSSQTISLGNISSRPSPFFPAPVTIETQKRPNETTAIFLFGLGLVGLSIYTKKKFKK